MENNNFDARSTEDRFFIRMLPPRQRGTLSCTWRLFQDISESRLGPSHGIVWHGDLIIRAEVRCANEEGESLSQRWRNTLWTIRRVCANVAR